jgi:hypothetical protein
MVNVVSTNVTKDDSTDFIVTTDSTMKDISICSLLSVVDCRQSKIPLGNISVAMLLVVRNLEIDD